ncbi:MAG: hypothetical protein KF809_17465 [Chloroflexi bacterium]|nr:hypothetical protein [Chloroflexota bacterium]
MLTATETQIRTLRVYLDADSASEAAVILGRTRRQVYRHLEVMRSANRCSTLQLAYRLGRWDMWEQMTLPWAA